MSLRQHTPTLLAVLVLCSVVLIGSRPARAVPTQADLSMATSDYQQAWHTAAETNQHRAALERTLHAAMSQVETARAEVEKNTRERHAIRADIVRKRKLIESLIKEMSAAKNLQQYYDGVFAEEREHFGSLIRFIALRRIELADTGPVIGGTLLRRLLRSSLGEAVQQELSRRALLTARRQLLAELTASREDTEGQADQLHASVMTLRSQITDLVETYGQLLSSAHLKAAALDNGWRTQQLTQGELATVRQETDEANQRVADMQRSLQSIHSELRDYRRRDLTRQIASLQPAMAELRQQQTQLQLQDAALKRAKEEELRAFSDAMKAKNTDPKQYRHVEKLMLLLKAKREQLSSLLSSSSSSSGLFPTALESPDGKPATVESLQADVAALEEKLALLQQGIPEDAADAYLTQRREAGQADQRTIAAQRIAEVSSQLAGLLKQESDLHGELDANERNLAFDTMPAGTFSWPVIGPLSAPYHDPDYERVFHVPHQGMDIVVPQGSPVHAISDGVVFAVKNGGSTGYTYVLIGHRNGYASLYGHLSSVLVAPGELVDAHQVIGFSGGTPGTTGAGHMTTGAHLHLEVLINGTHVDPRTVLP